MNIALMTEGKGEKSIYKAWVPCVNPNVTYVPNIRQMSHDNFSITSAFGYPGYFDLIDQTITDVNDQGNIDRLVICVDSEDMSLADKRREVQAYVAGKPCAAQIVVVVQHFCVETWALGNRRACRVIPKTPALATFRGVFDVRAQDPELLPAYASSNRAQFACAYLQAMLQDWNPHNVYVKGNPKPLCRPDYYYQVRQRLSDTNHIPSFDQFLRAFV